MKGAAHSQNLPVDVVTHVEHLERHCLAPDGSYMPKSHADLQQKACQARAYYYQGLVLDKGNAPSDHVGAVCCLLVTEELLKDGKRACLSFCLAAPVTRVPPAWDVMKHLNKKIHETTSKKAQMYVYLLEQEKLRVYPVRMHWWRSFFLFPVLRIIQVMNEPVRIVVMLFANPGDE